MKKQITLFFSILIVALLCAALLLFGKYSGQQIPKEEVGPHTTTVDSKSNVVGALTLKIGETKTVGVTALKFLSIKEDSRCPKNARCIWAGRVVTSVSLGMGTTTKVFDLSTEAPLLYNGYSFTLSKVLPEKTMEINNKYLLYQITVMIAKQS